MRRVAYFSMEIALEGAMKTYSGGLGVLAGDLLLAAADLHVPMLGVSLLNRKGYFHQELDSKGDQKEQPDPWPVEEHLERMETEVMVELCDRKVLVSAWKYVITGIGGYTVPVFFLDTDLQRNSEEDRQLCDYLYGKDSFYRICQEAILGVGGLRMLKALGYTNLERYHLNEGHAAFLALELLEERIAQRERSKVLQEDVDAVKELCAFTTHTPVAAGHDTFPMDMVANTLGSRKAWEMEHLYNFKGELNMTYLALNLSRYVNGVSKRNAELNQLIYAPYKIEAITNGVHAVRWACPSVQTLYDRRIPGWRSDNFSLRRALTIPKEEFWEAHQQAKEALLGYVERVTGVEMDPEVLTLGFARRATAYKRLDLLMDDLSRLRQIAKKGKGFQVIYGGKAHPHDYEGKELIRKVFQGIEALKEDVKIVYLPNYDVEVAKLVTSGVDVWMNTPQPPMEASGTSGMKAALNGIPSLSVLDGWWNEGCIEGVTGWAIDGDVRPAKGSEREEDANSIYEKLEKLILPLFYEQREQFINMMLHSVALNASFFNGQRMILQYDLRAYSKEG